MRNLGLSGQTDGHQQLVRLSEPTESVPVELDLSGFQENIAFTYFFERYAWAQFWRPLIQIHDNNVVSLEYKSSLALVYAYFGLKNRDRGTEVKGLELYGNTLSQVKSALGRDGKDELAKMTVSVMILGMFTYAMNEELEIQHHLGVSQILQHCGPRHFKEEPYLSAFRSCRRVLICQAFAQRGRTFLEQEEWKTLPFEVHQKGASDYLFDILVDMLGVIADMKRLQERGSQVSRDELACKVSFLASRLVSWRMDWEKANSSRASHQYSRALSNTIQPSQQARVSDFLNSPIEFETLEQATDIFTYNAALLYLMGFEDMLRGSGLKKGPLSDADLDYMIHASCSRSDTVLLAPSDVKLYCQPAVEAARILPFLRRHWVTGSGKIVAIMAPLGIVYCVLEQQPEIREYVNWESLLPAFDDSVRTELGVYGLCTRVDENK